MKSPQNLLGLYNGSFIFTIRESERVNQRESFVLREVKGSAAGWTYDETKFYIQLNYNDHGDTVESRDIYLLDEEGIPIEEKRPNGLNFTNSYYARRPIELLEPAAPAATAVPTNSNVPQTGDDTIWHSGSFCC